MSRLKQGFAAAAVAVLMLAGAQAVAVPQAEREAIAERIKPAGQLCRQGEPCAAAATPVASGPRSGSDVYNASCMACHSTGAAGAPKLGDKAAWSPLIAQGKPTLYEHAINGIRGMPPRGTCMSCSDAEIEAAVDHMVAGSQ